jgi:hypothetical protein
MMILEHPVTRQAAYLAALDWYHSTKRRTVKNTLIVLLLRHGGRYRSRWRVMKRSGTIELGRTWYYEACNRARWGGVALVAILQSVNSSTVIEFFCEPIRHNRKPIYETESDLDNACECVHNEQLHDPRCRTSR